MWRFLPFKIGSAFVTLANGFGIGIEPEVTFLSLEVVLGAGLGSATGTSKVFSKCWLY